jgi:hypothetical protein
MCRNRRSHTCLYLATVRRNIRGSGERKQECSLADGRIGYDAQSLPPGQLGRRLVNGQPKWLLPGNSLQSEAGLGVVLGMVVIHVLSVIG